MKHEEFIKSFRKEFATIVYIKGKLKSSKLYISKLSRYDKHDSHKEAILKAIENKDKILKELNEKLKGKTYEDWAEFSRKISLLQSKIKNSKNMKDKYINDLNNLFYEFSKQYLIIEKNKNGIFK